MRVALRYGCLFLFCAGAGLFLNRILFGDWVPLPFFAKTAGFYEGYLGATKWNAATGMILFWIVALPPLLAVIAMVTRRSIGLAGAILLPVSATFAYYATVTQIMGHQARYYYPSLAWAIFAAFVVVAIQLKERQREIPILGLRMLAGLLIMLSSLSFSFQQLATHLWERYAMGIRPQSCTVEVLPGKKPERRYPEIGWWKGIRSMSKLIAAMPEGIVLAASEYGYIGSQHQDLTILDFVGLHDRAVVRAVDSVTYILDRHPDIIWMPHSDYTHMVARIRAHPDFQANYEFHPDAYNFGVAINRSSRHYAAMQKMLTRHLELLYPEAD